MAPTTSAQVTPLTPSTFASTQLELLSIEQSADATSTAAYLSAYSPRALAAAGLALLHLVVSGRRTGLGGKTVLELEQDSAISGGKSADGGEGSPGLQESGIRVGDVVGLREMGGGGGGGKKKDKEKERDKDERQVTGVVLKVTRQIVSVALDREEQGGELEAVTAGKIWLVKLANEVTYKRMNHTMDKLAKLEEKDLSVFQRVMFGLDSPTPITISPEGLSDGSVQWITDRLNDSQKEAVQFALASREIALIHGPPGTGKTHTLIELILQLVAQGQRVLVCGPSNISVDNIVERLASHKVSMVRLGHPARLLPAVLGHSLDMLTKTSDAAALVQDVRREMDEKQAKIRKTRNGRERRTIYTELKDLRNEYRERERGCVDNLIRESKVVLATLHGAGGHQLKNTQFDVVIIDEASQALEAQCWVALLTAKKAVLAGDHLQLPPTIKSLNNRTGNASVEAVARADVPEKVTEKASADISTNGKNCTLEFTLFDRLLGLHGESIKRMLTIQYRMHQKIMAFPSQELYDARLQAAEAVKTRLLCDLPGVERNDDTAEPLIFFDTQGGDFPEKAGANAHERNPSGKNLGMGESKSNEMEVALVAWHVERLVEAGLKAEEIAVITPYNAQLALLSQALRERYQGIELGSVDGFQGREKEAIIFSLVRSNSEREVGFLAEKRRLNVAMTRPRRQLAVIGDSETIKQGGKFLKKWMAHLEEHADLRYPNPVELNTM